MSNLILSKKSNPVSWHSLIRGGKSNAIIGFGDGYIHHNLLVKNKYNRWHMEMLSLGGAICNAVGVEGG